MRGAEGSEERVSVAPVGMWYGMGNSGSLLTTQYGAS